MDIDTDEPQVADNNEALRPIAILIDELSQEDMQIRIGALKQVTRIAQALGSERTRDELIPYLTGNGLEKKNLLNCQEFF